MNREIAPNILEKTIKNAYLNKDYNRLMDIISDNFNHIVTVYEDESKRDDVNNRVFWALRVDDDTQDLGYFIEDGKYYNPITQETLDLNLILYTLYQKISPSKDDVSLDEQKHKRRIKKSKIKDLGLTSGDIAANMKTFNAMMSPTGGCIGEGYNRPDRYYSVSDEEAVWTPEGEDYYYWSSEADDWAEDYAQAYKCKMSPKDFLDLTTKEGSDNLKIGDNIWGEFKELDTDKFTSYEQPIYLEVLFKDENPKVAYVVGHEGRHRMLALREKGIKSVDVELYCKEYDSTYDRYKPFKLDTLVLVGQVNKTVSVVVHNLIPMSWKNHQAIRPNVRELKNYDKY